VNSVDAIDVFDQELFVGGPPHALFDWLRAEAPVYWNAAADDPDGGMWVLTRYADIVTVSRDTEAFSSAEGFSYPRQGPDTPAFRENIMFRDPPEHGAHRRPLNRTFTPRAMVDLEGSVRGIARGVLDEIDGVEAFDWVQRVAAELPARVVASLVGVPEVDHGKLVTWASDIFGRDGSPESDARFGVAVQAIMGYAEELKREKRACPGDDIMTQLLRAEVDGCPLSETTLSMWFLTLAQAGFETTHTLIAQGMALMAKHPELEVRIVSNRSDVRRVVDEMLRYITPVNMMARTATRDVELHGQVIKAGQYVTLWYTAANRDPAVFYRPHEFDVDRPGMSHLAFGGAGSPHYCLGAHLAKLEMRVLLEEMADRGFPYEVIGPPVRATGVFMNALKQLPVATRKISA
jgi:cholest-4-en-3-one 26-monooxygenase